MLLPSCLGMIFNSHGSFSFVPMLMNGILKILKASLVRIRIDHVLDLDCAHRKVIASESISTIASESCEAQIRALLFQMVMMNSVLMVSLEAFRQYCIGMMKAQFQTLSCVEW